jgi:septin family protein
LQDIRHAQLHKPDVPERMVPLQVKLMVTGQPETGRTTTIRNLFASVAQDPNWQPVDVSGHNMAHFRDDSASFETTICGVEDATGRHDITYIIQVSF